MQAEEYAQMHALETDYWWFVGRRRTALALLAAQWERRDLHILDLGCGTGAVTQELTAFGAVVGADMSSLALDFNKGRTEGQGVSLVQADGIALPFAANTFDAVVALDVFEHIDNHDLAFKETFRVLKPGGALVLSVPAFQWLWGPHDRALHHFRRYNRRELKHVLRDAGFSIKVLSFSVFLLFPIVVLIRVLDRFRRGPAKTTLPKVPNWANRFLTQVLALECTLIVRGPGLPIGSSLVGCLVKPE